MRLLKSDGKPYLPVIALVLLVAAFLLPSFVGSYRIVFLVNIIMHIVLAVSWTIFSGPTGYMSLATAAFFGLGYYIPVFTAGMPLPVMMLFGGAASFIVAFLLGAVTLRLRGVYFTIFTFGLVQLLNSLILWIAIRVSSRRGWNIASRAYVLENGRVVLGGGSAELLENDYIKKAYLGM